MNITVAIVINYLTNLLLFAVDVKLKIVVTVVYYQEVPLLLFLQQILLIDVEDDFLLTKTLYAVFIIIMRLTQRNCYLQRIILSQLYDRHLNHVLLLVEQPQNVLLIV